MQGYCGQGVVGLMLLSRPIYALLTKLARLVFAVLVFQRLLY